MLNCVAVIESDQSGGLNPSNHIRIIFVISHEEQRRISKLSFTILFFRSHSTNAMFNSVLFCSSAQVFNTIWGFFHNEFLFFVTPSQFRNMKSMHQNLPSYHIFLTKHLFYWTILAISRSTFHPYLGQFSVKSFNFKIQRLGHPIL